MREKSKSTIGNPIPKSMTLYHASPKQGIKYIEPHTAMAYNYLGPIVFASPYPAFAGCFGIEWNDTTMRQGTDPDDITKASMWVIDKNTDFTKPCSMYILENDGSFFELTERPHEVVSKRRIKVKREIKFSSYYSMMNTYNIELFDYTTKDQLPLTESTYVKENGRIIMLDGFEISREYGIYVGDVYNPIVELKGMDFKARGRSELLVVDGDKVYIGKNKSGVYGNYSVPGGGWEQGEPHSVSATREAEEEARLSTKNIQYVGKYLTIYDEVKPWLKDKVPEKDWWRAYYTEVYIAEYDHAYKGHIDEVDKDDLIKVGKFYPIKEVRKILNPIHRKALDDYLRNGNSIVKESLNVSSHIPSDIVKFNKELNLYEYGILINGKVHTEDDIDLSQYRTIPVRDFKKYRAGVCWDFVNYEADWFKRHRYEFNTYYIQIDNNADCPSHTFLVFRYNNKSYYFESSWMSHQGIYEFDTDNEAVSYVLKNHTEEFNKGNHPVYAWKYDTNGLDRGLTAIQFMNRIWSNGEEISITSLTESTFIPSDEPTYFYHMVPKGTVLNPGITSLEYQYRHNQDDLFNQYTNKYRNRISGGWGIYPDTPPEELTTTQIRDALNKFRHSKYGCSSIYLFRFPPYKALGKEMREILKSKDLYRIDLNEIKDLIEEIDYGHELSNTDNNTLDKDYYMNVTPSEYFDKYTEKGDALLFSYMNHISIRVTNNYIPKKYCTKIDIPDTIDDIMEDYSTVTESLELRLNRPLLPKSVTIYHGSDVAYNEIMPNCINYGTKFSKARMSSFWSLDRRIALLFALKDIMKTDKDIKRKSVMDVENFRILHFDDTGAGEAKLKSLFTSHPAILHTVTVNKSMLGAGHHPQLNEVSIDVPIKPDKIERLYWEDVKSLIDYMPEDELDGFINTIKKNKTKVKKYGVTPDLIYKSERQLSKSKSKYDALTESVIDSRDDIMSKFLEKGDTCANLQNWDPNGYNILYVTGLSGSGKTTLATDMRKEFNCYRIELDYISRNLFDRVKNDQTQRTKCINLLAEEAPKFVVDWVKSNYNNYSFDDWRGSVGAMTDFVTWMEVTHRGDGNLYIINGAPIPEMFDATYFTDRPIIIKKSAYLKSSIRRASRECGYFETTSEKIQMFIRNLKTVTSKGYRGERKHLNYFTDRVRDRATVIESIIPDNRYDTIVFDFGDVLDKRDKEYMYTYYDKYLSTTDLTMDEFKDIIKGYHKFAFAKYGSFKTARNLDTLYKNTLNPKYRQYYQHALNCMSGMVSLYEYAVPMLESLKSKGYKLYYLTNKSKWNWYGHGGKERMQPIMKYFDGGGIVSCDVGIEKPDIRIYNLLIKKAGLNPERTLFFDDKKINTDAANKVGMTGIVFTPDIVSEIMNFPSVNYDVLTESIDYTLEETKRSELPNSVFGVPSQRKYPLDTEQHVRSAIKLFNYVQPEFEKELATNILKRMKDFNITDISVGEKNRFSKYYKGGSK